MKIVMDFIDGSISYHEFKRAVLESDKIFDWLQTLLTDEMLNDFDFYCCDFLRRYRHSLKDCILSDMGEQIRHMLNTHAFISRYVQYAFPDLSITPTDYYSKLFDLYIKSVPDCYGGPEVDEILSQIVMDAPNELSTTKKVNWIKSKIKELFPGKRPYWIQSAEWPTYEGKPMIYIERNRNGDLFQYIFEDATSGKQRIVEQFA